MRTTRRGKEVGVVECTSTWFVKIVTPIGLSVCSRPLFLPNEDSSVIVQMWGGSLANSSSRLKFSIGQKSISQAIRCCRDRRSLRRNLIQASEHDDGAAATSPQVIRAAAIIQPTLVSFRFHQVNHPLPLNPGRGKAILGPDRSKVIEAITQSGLSQSFLFQRRDVCRSFSVVRRGICACDRRDSVQFSTT